MKKHPPDLKQISRCDKSLDFRPLNVWPETLPAVAFRGFVVAGFQNSEFAFDHPLEQAEPEEIAKSFSSLYAELTTPELARLWQSSANLDWFPRRLVLEKYHLHVNDSSIEVLDVITKLPMSFQNFCSQKKWHVGDFQFLVSARELDLEFLFQDVMLRNLSKSQSTQILENLVDLLLLETEPQQLRTADNETAEAWVTRIQKIRYPKSTADDAQAALAIKSLAWPPGTQARWVRQGDQTGLEIKFFVSQPSEMSKQLQAFQNVSDNLENAGPWKKH